ncbi:ABC transporter ATP-binding protein [Candidatus Bathyarchaeota archaeon A05DMB-2]|jgi:ABC-2 type transport system ATP-binding protein|nr:ABC transporter ATP-binding protein [Candidatus Bathyarchaeota archaeon A05DMB-2]
MELVIETNNLTKRYGALTAVNKLNLKVQRGSIHGFLGPNGAGKTTTIKIIVGLLRPDEGTVKVLGHELHGGKNEGFLQTFREQADSRLGIGYMPELPKFPKHLKGSELLDIYGRMYGMTEQQRKEQIPKLIEMVGLTGRENDLIGKYSKGMQQRIGIAQALLNSPELVILDEPSLGLDPVGMVEVRELVKNIAREGITVFVSSHLLFEVEQICTDVTIINRGTALASDTLQNVSGLLTGPAMIHVEVAQMSQNIINAVKSLPFVSNVTQTGNSLIIQVTTHEDVRTQVSKEITRAGGIIVDMSQKTSNLEDVFIQLVSKDQEGKTQ